jgi:hypothetical protein
MDDFNVSSLHESKNEWGARLLTILTPLIVEGLRSIFDESYKLCKNNNEVDKYLMTFQNFITRIPKWNQSVIEQESKRIIEKSRCNYLEDLITCVHIIQLKLLTSMRVGQKQKKIDIHIPKLDDFIHKTYINVARKIYKNVYLFEINIPPLQVQKHNRELEIIIQECILNTIRDSIPIENILKAYMDETVEEDVVEDIKEEIIEEKMPTKSQDGHLSTSNSEETKHIIEGGSTERGSTDNTSSLLSVEKSASALSFNDVDMARSSDNQEESIHAPKDIERLEEISNLRNMQRKLESDDEDDIPSNSKLTIHDQPAELGNLDVHVINPPSMNLNEDFLLDDIEILV